MEDKTSVVLEKITLRLLEVMDAENDLPHPISEYSEGFLNGIAYALQIVNGGKQDDKA